MSDSTKWSEENVKIATNMQGIIDQSAKLMLEVANRGFITFDSPREKEKYFATMQSIVAKSEEEYSKKNYKFVREAMRAVLSSLADTLSDMVKDSYRVQAMYENKQVVNTSASAGADASAGAGASVGAGADTGADTGADPIVATTNTNVD